jgi:hypothetical protein
MITLLRDHSDGRTGQVPDSEGERRLNLFEQFGQFMLKRRANLMLKRIVGPHPIGRVTSLSPHLLKDIGLPPDYRL